MKKCAIDPELVARMYFDEGMKTPLIAKEFGVSTETIRRLLQKSEKCQSMGGKLERQGREQALSITPEELKKLYWDEMLSADKIGQMFGVTSSSIVNYLKRYDIPRRPPRGQRGELNSWWNGGKTIDKSGYVLVLVGKNNHPLANSAGYVREHRLVMEKVLGRYLEPTEVVHHKDGNKQNNAPENLELYASNGEHLKDELTGKVPNWTEAGKERIKNASVVLPAWTEERKARTRERLRKEWQDGTRNRKFGAEHRARLSQSAKNRQMIRNEYGQFVPTSQSDLQFANPSA